MRLQRKLPSEKMDGLLSLNRRRVAEKQCDGLFDFGRHLWVARAKLNDEAWKL